MEEVVSAIMAEGVLQRRTEEEEARPPARPQDPVTAPPLRALALGVRRLGWSVAILLLLWAYTFAMGPVLLAIHSAGWVSDETYASLAVAPLLVWAATAALGIGLAAAAACLFCLWIWDSTPRDRGRDTREALRWHGRAAAVVWGV